MSKRRNDYNSLVESKIKKIINPKKKVKTKLLKQKTMSKIIELEKYFQNKLSRRFQNKNMNK